MGQFNKYVGLDTHKETIAVSVADAAGGKARYFGEVANRPAAIKKLIQFLKVPLLMFKSSATDRTLRLPRVYTFSSACCRKDSL